MPLAAGTRLGTYEILAPLGAGGMGEVYRARDTRLQREVALKILPASFADHPDRLRRFEREARVLASLNHPHIAQIYGFEDSGGVHALIMELVTGRDLAALMASGPVPQDQVVAIARQIAEALEAAHEAGVVHRDLKPGNVQVRRDGTVKVLDFGLAKAGEPADGSTTPTSDTSPTMTVDALSSAGLILGTAAYMSPEQARGLPVDRRTDIWAFGVVLFEMVTGGRLFTGETPSDLIASVLRQEIDWTLLPADTSESLRHLLARCLERDVTKRLPTMSEARRILAGESGSWRAPTASPSRATDASGAPAARVRPGASGVIGVAVVLLCVLAAGIAWVVWGRPRTTGGNSPAVATHTGRSIAVLPFINGSGKADDEYVSDGITDELIAGLGQVPGLRVAARSSSFAFKGKETEAREIAKRLGVETLLEGALQRSGRKLRVTASLVNATDGLQIWSSTYQDESGDTFTLQDQVTRGVVDGLTLKLGGSALAASQAGRTSDPEAQDLYLRGLSLAHNVTESDLRRALEYFQQALARDPDFALAYAEIAWVYMGLADAYMAPDQAYPKARVAAEAAIARDSLVAEAHAARGYALSAYDWDQVSAAREFHRALELNPNSSFTLFLYGLDLGQLGHPDEGVALLDKAIRLDPLSPVPYWCKEFCDLTARRYDAVSATYRKEREVDPHFCYLTSWGGAALREQGDLAGAVKLFQEDERNAGGAPQYGLAITEAHMGRLPEARAIARRLDERAKAHYVPFWVRAAVRGSLGDMDTAVELLQRSLDTRESWLLTARHMPDLAILVKDPRVRALYDRMDAIQAASAGKAR